MREIPVGRGRVTLVDDADYEWLSQWQWSSRSMKSSLWYVSRIERGTRKYISMHRLITNAPKGMDVDHIDGNGLNNCRSNLRVCTHSGNLKNRRPSRKRAATSSRFKGVNYCNDGSNKWSVSICSDGVRYSAKGRFTSEEAAARAYDELARKHHGEFARLNFPDVRPPKAQGPIRRLISRIVSRVSFGQRKSGLFHGDRT